jgi:hypothetical protein
MSGAAWWSDIDYRCSVSGCGAPALDSMVYKDQGLGGKIGWRIHGACEAHEQLVLRMISFDDGAGNPHVMSGELETVMSWLDCPDRKLAFISIVTPSA